MSLDMGIKIRLPSKTSYCIFRGLILKINCEYGHAESLSTP